MNLPDRALRNLLHASWWEIGYDYDGLTSSEQACLTREEHAALVAWLKAHAAEDDAADPAHWLVPRDFAPAS